MVDVQSRREAAASESLNRQRRRAPHRGRHDLQAVTPSTETRRTPWNEVIQLRHRQRRPLWQFYGGGGKAGLIVFYPQHCLSVAQQNKAFYGDTRQFMIKSVALDN